MCVDAGELLQEIVCEKTLVLYLSLQRVSFFDRFTVLVERLVQSVSFDEPFLLVLLILLEFLNLHVKTA